MKKLFRNALALAILVLFFGSMAYAEKVRVYTDYNPVRILHLVEGTNFDLEANKSGLEGNFKEIDDSAIPKDRSDRDAWKFEKGGVVVDPVKKQLKADIKAKKELDKASVIEKLKGIGFTDDEIKALPEIQNMEKED